MSDKRPIVCKFGGTLADAAAFKRVAAIIRSDPNRRYVVVSAPGKRHKDDVKITDLLIENEWHRNDIVFGAIEDRFRDIAKGLELDEDWVEGEIYFFLELLKTANHKPFFVSRGEWMNARLLAKYLNWPFQDSTDCIRFTPDGDVDLKETKRLVSAMGKRLDRAIIPGYYGATDEGIIFTFPRGGSDTSGALVACGVNASVYENWKDVPGLLRADPKIVPGAKTVSTIIPEELRELAYMGTEVLHPEAVSLVWQAGIPLHIRNINQPESPGTMVTPDIAGPGETSLVTGIAGRRGFSVVTASKALVKAEKGLPVRFLTVFEKHDITVEHATVEHAPSGVDMVTAIVQAAQLNDVAEAVLVDIKEQCNPDTIEVQSDVALVAVVGRGMRHVPGTAARVFTALGNADINIRVIGQGPSELTIIVGVESKDYEAAIQAIHGAFFI